MKIMKTANFKKFLFLPLLFVMFLVSCQDEVTEVTNPNDEDTIAGNSSLANLMRNTAANDGSTDNIIDFANCLEIQLPVTVIVDGIEIIIDSETDFDDIEAIFDEFEGDEDDLEIVFPITVIFSDYTTLVVANQEALEDLIDDCNDEDEEDDDIECIDFQYPITISVYNTDFEVIDTVTINDDEALYDFIEDLEGGVLASLNFPVTMVLSDGSTIVVENNAALEAAISDAEDDCDEDDDYDWDDDDYEDCTEDYVASMLLECNWHYATSLYSSFTPEYFNFSSDGTALIYNAITGDLVNTGTWSLSSETDAIYLDLVFDADPYSLLTLSWELVACDDDRFEFINGDNNLVFEQDCDEDPITDCDFNLAGFESYLLACNVEVYTYDAAGNIIDENYVMFNAGGEVIVNGTPAVTEEGSWSLSESSSGYVLTIDGLVTFDLLNGEWLLLGCEDDDLILQQGTGSDTIIMELEQDCETTAGCGEEDVDAYLVECIWNVVNFEGRDDLIGWDFAFNSDGTVVVTGEGLTAVAMWSTSMSADGVIVTFTGIALPDIQVVDGAWLVVECEEGRLQFVNNDNETFVMERDCE